MKQFISIMLIGYFVALGGGATLVTHFCEGEHVFTMINPATAETSCCSEKSGMETAGCSDDTKSCGQKQEQRQSCHSEKSNCEKSCCEEEIVSFQLPEITQPMRILPEDPSEIQVFSLTPALNAILSTIAFQEFNPFLSVYSNTPPALNKHEQPVLAVFLL